MSTIDGIKIEIADGVPVGYTAHPVSQNLAAVSRCYGCGLRGAGACVLIHCEPWERQDRQRVIYVKNKKI